MLGVQEVVQTYDKREQAEYRAVGVRMHGLKLNVPIFPFSVCCLEKFFFC